MGKYRFKILWWRNLPDSVHCMENTDWYILKICGRNHILWSN